MNLASKFVGKKVLIASRTAEYEEEIAKDFKFDKYETFTNYMKRRTYLYPLKKYPDSDLSPGMEEEKIHAIFMLAETPGECYYFFLSVKL